MSLSLLTGQYIPPQGLRALNEYKYVAGTYSWLDLQLNPFWAWCAELFPTWFAPNAITLLGTSFLLSMAVLIQVFDPTLEGEAPRWVYVWFAVCIWWYQTLDAVDGKQARRTKSSSPLGQLFDHGCDCWGTMPLALALCSALGLGPTISAVVVCATIQIPFFTSQFEEHFAHTVRTQIANFGVTEGQYLEAGLMLLTGIGGREFWDNVLFELGSGDDKIVVDFRLCVFLSGCLFPGIMACASLITVARTEEGGKPEVFFGKLAGIAFLYSFLFWIGIGASAASATTTTTINNGDGNDLDSSAIHPLARLFVEAPVAFCLTFGFLYTFYTSQVILSSVTKTGFPAFPPAHTIAPLVVLVLFAREMEYETTFKAFTVVYACLVCFQYLHFAISVSEQIAAHLNIKVLSLGPAKPAIS